MGMRYGNLRVGEISNKVFLISNTYMPRKYAGNHTITFSNANNFKIVDEPNFFGAYHSNTNLKAKIYRDLRHQIHLNASQLKTSISNQFDNFILNDPQYAIYDQLAQASKSAPNSIKKSLVNLQQYEFTNKFYIYTKCHFDDVNVYGKINFPNWEGEVSFSYEILTPPIAMP